MNVLKGLSRMDARRPLTSLNLKDCVALWRPRSADKHDYATTKGNFQSRRQIYADLDRRSHVVA